MSNSLCIGCGCTDERACKSGCSWMRLDTDAGIGVCSNCFRDVSRWDGGDRSVSDAAHEHRTGRCRSCNGRVIWFKTALGKNMPVDESSVEQNDVKLDMRRHISHFASCPNADKHRKAR